MVELLRCVTWNFEAYAWIQGRGHLVERAEIKKGGWPGSLATPPFDYRSHPKGAAPTLTMLED